MIRTFVKSALTGAIALGLATSAAYAQQNPCAPKGANPCAATKKDSPPPAPTSKTADNKNPCAPNPCAAKK